MVGQSIGGAIGNQLEKWVKPSDDEICVLIIPFFMMSFGLIYNFS